jgi:hypothetical protein
MCSRYVPVVDVFWRFYRLAPVGVRGSDFSKPQGKYSTKPEFEELRSTKPSHLPGASFTRNACPVEYPEWLLRSPAASGKTNDKQRAYAEVVPSQWTRTALPLRGQNDGPYVPTVYALPNYDVSPDGQRFLMVKDSEQVTSGAQINVVLNWSEEPKRRVPTGNK